MRSCRAGTDACFPMSSSGLSGGSSSQRASAFADAWMVGTSPTTTKRKVHAEHRNRFTLLRGDGRRDRGDHLRGHVEGRVPIGYLMPARDRPEIRVGRPDAPVLV